MRHAFTLLLFVASISFSPLIAQAQWQPDGLALCTAASGQFSPRIVSDDAGGAIVAWYDGRSGGFDYPIYAQRVNAAGVHQWTVDGVALSTTGGEFAMVSDGAGGAIVTWNGARAQRVNASGVLQWIPGGVALCTDTTSQQLGKIASDGAGGAIVAWADDRYDVNNFTTDIYAQRVSAGGIPQWTTDGVALCTAVNHQVSPAPVSDGAGGAIVTWIDYRSGTTDIYAQRVSALGATQWTADGVVLCAALYDQWKPAILSDDAGGAIVTWEDIRDGDTADIYAQRVDAVGVPQWAVNGIALCTQPFYQYDPVIVADGAGGAIVTWEDPRDGVQFDIYAQRVSPSGALQWTTDGVALSTALGDQRDPMIDSDGAGGAIVAWSDRRSGYDIYAQHAASTPNTVAIVSFDAFEVGGVVTLRSAFRSDLAVDVVNVYRGVGTNDDPLTIIERAHDVRRDGFDYVDHDVAPGQTYRYQIGVVDADGEFFSPIVTVSVNAIAGKLSQNKPNPFNPTTTIRFTLPTREDVTLEIYDTNGQLVRTLVNEVEGSGTHEVTWDGRDNAGVAAGSGVYFYRLHAGKVTESKKMVLLK